MKILGLTGDIACGKSTVAALLKNFGACVLDADQLVRELYADPIFAKKVAVLFGTGVLDEQNAVNRKALGAIVFSSADALQELEALVHPAVAELRARKLKSIRSQSQPPPAVIFEAVKLIESGQVPGCDEVWCVTSTLAIQLERLMATRGLSEVEARARLKAQPSREAKRARIESSAPGVPLVFIENSASPEKLARDVEQEWQRFVSSEYSPLTS